MANTPEYRRAYKERIKREQPEKYREQRREQKRRARKWYHRSIVAWDGEGCNLGSDQLYVLLANSKGDTLVNRGGLSTYECLSFLCANTNPRDINVIFGGSYDANQWLADLPRKNLEEIWTKGVTHFAGFWISYQWRKRFCVKDEKGNSATIWDVLGFFQGAFVDVVKLWLPSEDVSKMAAMKLARPSFDLRELDEIIEYNADECRLLVRVCEELFKAFDHAGIVLNRYDGAGAVAASMMAAHGVHLMHQPEPPVVNLAARYAYAGGRIEAPRVGTLDEGDVFRHDINSAYPTNIVGLPCLAHGMWRYDESGSQRPRWSAFSVVHVRWSFTESPFYPFFYRDESGRILFPRDGEGWYWLPEIVAAEEAGFRFDVVEAFTWQQECKHMPFSWVDEMYEQRQHYKQLLAQGDPTGMAEIPLKLGLNSLYGKMAQQLGAMGKAPKSHNLCWAGYVTSATRAMMFRVGMQHPEDVIAFATDAVISTKLHEVPEGKELGQWSVDRFDGIVMVQPGVYFLREHGEDWPEDDTAKAKYRGFDRGTLSRKGIIDTWQNGCQDPTCDRAGRQDHYHARLSRFVGAGSALASPSWYHRWRTWRTEDRLLDVMPGGKRRRDPRVDPSEYANGLVATLPEVNPTPNLVSRPHALAWLGSSGTQDDGDEVPMRIVESELQDSWA